MSHPTFLLRLCLKTGSASTATIPAKIGGWGHPRFNVKTVWRSVIFVLLAMLIPIRFAKADDEPKPEQLRQLLENTLSQLKSAQERKTQLAEENEQLKAKVVDLEKQLKDKSSEIKRQADAIAERSFFLRSHYAAWQEFIRRYPKMQNRWRAFLELDLMTPEDDLRHYVDPDWPWSVNG